MSTELSLRLSDRGCLELNFLVESKKDSIVGGWIFAITCQQAKCLDSASECEMKNTAHQYSVLTFSCAICIQVWKCTGNQKSLIIANTFFKVLLCCVHKSRRWPCASPSDLDALHFAWLIYFFLGIILRFNF